MGIILKLVWRDFAKHRSMFFFAFLSIVAVSCLVVWFVASIDTESLADDNGMKSFFGTYTLAVSSQKAVDADTLDTIYEQSGTSNIVNAFQFPADLRLENFKDALIPSGMGARKSPMLLGIGAKTSPFELEDGRWFRNEMECVASSGASKILTLGKRDVVPGDKIRVKTSNGDFLLTVTGTLEQDEVRQRVRGAPSSSMPGGSSTFAFGFGLGIGGGEMGGGAPKAAQARKTPVSERFSEKKSISPVLPSVYISLADAARISGDADGVNIVYIRLAEPEKVKDFYKNLERDLGCPLKDAALASHDTLVPEKKGGEKGFSAETVISQAWSTIGIVIIASVFIIFTTLNMGVSEKVRFLAMLRTTGFTRTQLALYVITEGVALGLLGWLAGLGAGWFLLTLLIYLQTSAFPLVSLTFPCIVFAFACSFAGSLAASTVPAWRATRISPAESMVRRTEKLSWKRLVFSGVFGAVLLGAIPFAVFCLPFSPSVRILIFSTLGTVFLGAGFLLLFPLLIVITEKVFSPAVSFIFSFNVKFISGILSSNRRRTLGTAIALSIGLGLFCAIHIWSDSMLSMFSVPDTIPNWLVRFHEGVISPVTTDGVRGMKGVIPDRFMSISVAQPELDAPLRERMRAAKAMGSNVVIFGVEPEKAWGGSNPMLRMDFVEGSRRKVLEEFSKSGARVCVIPETFSIHANLHVGDTLRLAKSQERAVERRGGASVQTDEAEYAEYRVVGVVDFAWVWLTKCSGVRVSAGRTAAAVFTPSGTLKDDFGSPDNEFFWFDTEKGVEFQDVDDYMKSLAAKSASLNGGGVSGRSFSGGTRWDSGINTSFVQVSSVESLNNSLDSRASSVIETMTEMPLVILILSTIAVINTMVVSVRSRRWEMGVLRACGVTRGGLVRMIVAEAVLIGICACVMSFSFGVFYSWLATRMVEYAPIFGITAPHLSIPFGKLACGFALTLGVCLCAGICPAVTAGMKEPALLLQRKD